MDSTKTAAFELGSGADACLLLHGFTGSPWELRPLGEALAARGMRVVAPLLPGHGRTPEHMERADRHDWLRAADEALAALFPHRRVFIGGLSMGALLAVLLAAKHQEKVAALALMAPALSFRGPAMKLLRSVRRLPLLELARPWVKKTTLDLQDPVERANAPVLSSFPSVRLNDLFDLQDLVRAAMPKVVSPSLVVVAANDHVVSAEGGRALARGLVNAGPVRFVRLDEGSHQMARDLGRETLFTEVGEFFARMGERR